jgi:protoporphyrinogen oxidase
VLISSLPLKALVGLLVDPPPEVTAAAGRLRCNPLYYLDLALDAPCGMDLHWVYVPEEKYPFYRVGCYSNFSEQMAPPGKAGLYVELASREPPRLDRLLPVVAGGLVEMKLIRRPAEILFARARLIEHAYVVFDRSYYPALEKVQAFLLEQNIISCGRYGGWDYSCMEDALLAGREAARRAEGMLK